MQRLMIIEDEECIRETLGIFSEMLGYEPIIATDSSSCPAIHSDGQECLKDHPCADILLIDQGLPSISGLNFIESQIQKGCKVLAHRKALMSGALTKEEFIRTQKIGCHFLQKPVTFDVLKDWLAGI